MSIVFYHRTTAANAQSILRDGFKDGVGKYMFEIEEPLAGVWLSKTPFDENEGAYGDVVLEVAIDAEPEEIAEWEVIEEDEPCREWLMSADFINSRGTIAILDAAEIDRLETLEVWRKYDLYRSDGR